jgi:hypothetical protein
VTFRINKIAWVRENKLTKRPDLKHTRYAYKPRVQHPAVAVAIGPHIFYGPEGRTLRDHDIVVAERRYYGGQIGLSKLGRSGWRAGVKAFEVEPPQLNVALVNVNKLSRVNRV